MLGYDMFLKYSSIDVEKLSESTEEEIDEALFGKYKTPLFENLDSGTRIVDVIGGFSTLNESDCNWSELNEESKWEIENAIWEGIAAYMEIEEGEINEGFWDGIVSGFKKLGKKGIQLAKATIGGIGKIFQKILKGLKGLVKLVTQKGISMGQKVWGMVQGACEERFSRLQSKHSQEEVSKDMEDWNKTTEWITGKGPESIVSKDTQKAAAAVGASMGDDKDGKEEAEETIARAEQRLKDGKSGAAKESQEIFNDGQSSINAIDFVNQFRQGADGSLYEELCDMIAAHIDESEDFVKLFENENIGPVNEFFGIFKKKDKKKDEKPETPAEEDKEKELQQKDEEAAKAKRANIPDVGDPKGDAEEKVEGAADDAKTSSWKGLISKVKQIAFGGLATLMEMVMTWLIKGAFSGVSSVIKRFGGPGVFVWAAIAFGIAFIITLGLEAFSQFGISHEAEGLAKMFSAGMHYSGLLPIVVSLLAKAFAEFTGVATTIKVAGLFVVAGIGISHLKHYFTYEAHAGPPMNHEKAIEMEEALARENAEEAETTEDPTLKKKLEELAVINGKLSEAHEKMIPIEKEFAKLEEEDLPDAKKALKKAKYALKNTGGGAIVLRDLENAFEKVENLKHEKKGIDKSIKQAKELLAQMEEDKGTKDEGNYGKNDKKDTEELIKKLEGRKKDLPKQLEDAEADLEKTFKKEGSRGDEEDEKMVANLRKALKDLKEVEHKIHEKGHTLKHKKEEVIGQLLEDKTMTKRTIDSLKEKIKKAKKEAEKAKNENDDYAYNVMDSSFKTFESFISEFENEDIHKEIAEAINSVKSYRESGSKDAAALIEMLMKNSTPVWPGQKKAKV
jgi:hypothetical protein